MEAIVNHCQWYRNFTAPIVAALKYLTHLSFDVLICMKFLCIVSFSLDILLVLLAKSETLTKKDGMSSATWLTNLAEFCGNIA